MKPSISIFSILLVISTLLGSNRETKHGTLQSVERANKRILKSEINMDKMKRMEPDYRRGTSSSRYPCSWQSPNNQNSFITLIDSSSNGYGMVSTVTRPIDVNIDGNAMVVYRQYAGENTTHGQLGAAVGVTGDGEMMEWNTQYNINANGNPPWGGGGSGGMLSSQARYPSAIATGEYPYAIWNEYTGNGDNWESDYCSNYGGRPYFSYDEFGWGGESWAYPYELDPLWTCEKDFWKASVGHAEGHVSAVFNDWTRSGSYLFTSEAVEDGFPVFGEETLIINSAHLGDYISDPILSMNEAGQGLIGISGFFAGVDIDSGTCSPPASNITCNRTPMIKLTDDFGQTWNGDINAFDFYYVPDNVFDDIMSNWPEAVVDACTGEESTIDDYWSWYDFDMRVDNAGNLHIVMSLVATSEEFVHFLDGYTGFYHLTIDRDYIASPGEVNTSTGWNWSLIPLPANDSFEWERPDGYSYVYGTMPQISLDRDNNDIVYITANIAEEGEMSSEYDSDGDGVEDDPCELPDEAWQLYPEWSEDIWVARSDDNGSTWNNVENLTQTPRDAENMGENNCAPEEQYVHAAHWADDNRVYLTYNQPNWDWNEIGDPLGADYMNRVFAGYASVSEGDDSGTCSDCENDYTNYGSECCDTAWDEYDINCADLEANYNWDCSGCDCPGDTYGGDEISIEDQNLTQSTCYAGNLYEVSDDWKLADWNGATNGGHYNVIFISMHATWCPSCYAEQTGPAATLHQTYEDNSHVKFLTALSDPGQPYSCQQWGNIPDGGANQIIHDAEYDIYDLFNTNNYIPSSIWIDHEMRVFDKTNSTTSYSIASRIGLMLEDCGELCEDHGPCDEYGMGDVNLDGQVNVVDISVIVSYMVFGTDLDGCASEAADISEDGFINVLDVVLLVNLILARSDDMADATTGTLIRHNDVLSLEANGYVGGVQMTLSHDLNFSIDLTDNAFIAEYNTIATETKLVIVTPESAELFTYKGDFEIVDMIIANSSEAIQVTSIPAAFNLSEAYPNPFNPVTSISFSLPEARNVSMQVYNLQGRAIETLVNGNMAAGYHTLQWNADKHASGVYFVKMIAGEYIETQKLMLMK